MSDGDRELEIKPLFSMCRGHKHYQTPPYDKHNTELHQISSKTIIILLPPAYINMKSKVDPIFVPVKRNQQHQNPPILSL